jgi:hypothetical protein
LHPTLWGSVRALSAGLRQRFRIAAPALAARDGLSNEGLTRLGGLHLLYDSEDEGAFWHACTEGFMDRLFSIG